MQEILNSSALKWSYCFLALTHQYVECYFSAYMNNSFMHDVLKELITVGRELRQQHPSDLLSGAGMSRERSSRPTVINPDCNMTKQRCMKPTYDKIHPKSPPNLATSPTRLHFEVTHLSLTTGVVALHIPSWRIEVHEERRQARKIVWPVNAGRVICRYQNNLCGIINHYKHIRCCFLGV